MFKLVRKMTKIALHLFGFEAKTLVLVAPVPGHCLRLTFYQSDFNTSPVDSYKINVSLIFLQICLCNFDECLGSELSRIGQTIQIIFGLVLVQLRFSL